MVFGRSGGVRGEGHVPYEEIPSNFGRVWSYRTWRRSIFMFFGNIGNSLHHQIPPNWSSGLQIGLRIFFKARVPSHELSNKLIFQKNTQKNKYVQGNWTTSQPRHLLINWLPFLCIFLGPMGPGTTRPSFFVRFGYPFLLSFFAILFCCRFRCNAGVGLAR